MSHLPASIFQISRSTPPLLHPSTKMTFFNYFVCCNLLKNGIHDNAGNGIVLLANAISGIGCNKNERKIPQMKGKNGSTAKRQAQNPTGNRAFVFSSPELVALAGVELSSTNTEEQPI